MASTMHRAGRSGLERSCAQPHDWFRIDASRAGFERAEVCLATRGFAPHRHDTYTIGITLHGVQRFEYRGAQAHSEPGQAFVLHPDELHDGRPGTGDGLHYRTLYIEPRLIQEALGAPCLPFVRRAVTDDARLRAAIVSALEDPGVAVGDLHLDHSLVQLAEALAALDRSARRLQAERTNMRAVTAAREFLDANLPAAVASVTLERITGLSRFALTRHFRAGLGTSPHRYVVMRRLDRARRLIRAGTPLAEAAAASGFADQSHMTRHFKKAYGVSPARWSALARA
ncbi:MAG TPA: AraC family transcriptional regulator [Alphaproteobacteria bacterium]|nr:AraC family transcriptional regulator [Alphaproteobacteria bacterium]